MGHKIERFKEILPRVNFQNSFEVFNCNNLEFLTDDWQAFPSDGDLILDAEMILVDEVTGDLLPFGTLGVHKRTEHKNGVICLFVFDCLLFYGVDLTNE